MAKVVFVLLLVIPLSLALLSVGLEVFNFLQTRDSRQRIDEYKSRNDSSEDTQKQRHLDSLANTANDLLAKTVALQSRINALGSSHLEGTSGIRLKLEDIRQTLEQMTLSTNSTETAEKNRTITLEGCRSESVQCTPAVAVDPVGSFQFSECQTKEMDYLEGEVQGENIVNGMINVTQVVHRYCKVTGLNASAMASTVLNTVPAVGSSLVLDSDKWSCICYGLVYTGQSTAPLQSYTCNLVVTTCNQRNSISY